MAGRRNVAGSSQTLAAGVDDMGKGARLQWARQPGHGLSRDDNDGGKGPEGWMPMTGIPSAHQGVPDSDDDSPHSSDILDHQALDRECDGDNMSMVSHRGHYPPPGDSATVYACLTGRRTWPDGCSSTRSLWARDLDYREINGRSYCRDYYMPNDEAEQLRLSIQHQVIRHAFDGDITLAPVDNPSNVLDVGTGTGDWAIDFAELYPDCEVVGTDISAMQETRGIPMNVFFEIEDAEEWDRPRDHYDLVHVRCLEGSLSDWHSFYKNIHDSLKPGGWLQIADMDGKEGSYQFFSAFPADAPIFRIMDDIFNGAEKAGRPRGIHHLDPEHLVRAGFVDVEVREKKFPMAIHEETVGKLWLMAWLDGLEAYALRTLTEVMGWDPDVAIKELRETARQLARLAQNEESCKSMTLTMRVVLARKPSFGEGGY